MTEQVEGKREVPTLTEEDRAWAEKQVPAMFHPVLEKHGRLCFSLAMQSGMLGHGLGELMVCAREAMRIKTHRSAQIAQAIPRLVSTQQGILNDLLTRIMKDNAISIEEFNECKESIERIGVLASGANPQAVGSPSGLILPH